MDTIKFKASLSNGENAIEGVGEYAEVPGELSPIQRLIANCGERALSITSLVLFKDNREWHLPSNANQPKFRAFQDGMRPKWYKVYRKFGRDFLSSPGAAPEDDYFTVAEAGYETYSIQLWVNDRAPHNSYILVRNIT